MKRLHKNAINRLCHALISTQQNGTCRRSAQGSCQGVAGEQTEDFYFSGNVANALNSMAIILKNKVLFVTFQFFFMVELQNFLNAPRIFNFFKNQ